MLSVCPTQFPTHSTSMSTNPPVWKAEHTVLHADCQKWLILTKISNLQEREGKKWGLIDDVIAYG